MINKMNSEEIKKEEDLVPEGTNLPQTTRFEEETASQLQTLEETDFPPQTGEPNQIPAEDSQMSRPPISGPEPPFYSPPSQPTASFEEPPTSRHPLGKKILFGLLILAAIGGLGFLGKNFFLKSKKNLVSPKPVVLTYWGLWEQEAVIQGLIEEFEKQNPEIKVKYELRSKQDYKARLQNSFLQKQGPDIFRFHQSWLPVLKEDLVPVPQTVVDNLGLEKDYFAVIPRTLKIDNQFYAIPLMIDTLALFYNRQLLATAGEQPPRTWWGMQEVVKKITVKDETGKIKIAGVALGTTNNIDHWSDIVGLMLFQNGVDFKNLEANSKLVEDVLKFYTLFYLRDRVWDATLPSSTFSFATNKLIFYFAPSWRIFNILETNPNLDFAVVPVPKLPQDPKSSNLEAIEKGEGELSQINWATFWVEGVSKQSPHQKEAWKFLEFLGSQEGLKKFYQAASQVREFGEIYPVKGLAQSLKANPRLVPFIDQAETAFSWYLCSFTYDSGPNEVMIKYFADAINNINQGGDPRAATQTLIQGISQTVSRYRLP